MKKISKKVRGEWIFAYSFLIFPLILFAIFYVYVNIDSLLLAFQDIYIDNSRHFVGLIHFKNFVNGLSNGGEVISYAFKNSIIMYLVGLLIVTPLQILFSYMLFKKCFAHRTIRILVMLPAIISSLVYCLIFKIFLDKPLVNIMHLLGREDFQNPLNVKQFETALVYSVWVAFSSSLIIYPNAMRSIDPAIFESASIDGMSTMWQEIRYIILPLIFPTLSTFLVLSFANCMSECGALIPFFRYSASQKAYTMGYYLTVQVFGDLTSQANLPDAAAAGLVLTIIVAPFTLLLNKLLNRINPVKE